MGDEMSDHWMMKAERCQHSGGKSSEFTAPTPQNTPLNNAPLTREALSRPTVGTIGEEGEETAAQGEFSQSD